MDGRPSTQADGSFEILDVSSNLFFGLAAGAQGYRGQLVEGVDPLEPDLTIRIARLKDDGPHKTLSGRVVDLQGEPVSGAVVTVGTVVYQNGRLRGPDEGITPATVTDARGDFLLSVNSPLRSLVLKTRAAGFAAVDTGGFDVGRPNQVIRLGPGASLAGTVMYDGKPVSGLHLEIVQADRSIGNVITPEEITTDANGSFRFDNLPPNIDYSICSLIGQSGAAALPVTIVAAPDHGQLAELGDVDAQPAHQLRLRFITKDRSPLPPAAGFFISRSKSWQAYREPLPEAPTVNSIVGGLAPEVIHLGIRIPGFEVVQTEPRVQVDLNNSLVFFSASEQSITVVLDKKAQ
ncbi:MAG: hypothetical protein ACO1RT_19450 [Planctomycetaceae bacterium]